MEVKPLDAPEPCLAPALHYRVWKRFEDAGPLQQEWDDLAARAGDILCTYDWCQVWWKYFGRYRQLEIHTLHDGGRLVAVLPLFRETVHPAGIRLRTVRVVGCDYTIGVVGLAIEPTYADRFTRMVLDRLSQDASWDILQIGPLRSYASVCDTVGQACASHPNVQTLIEGRRDNWCTIFHLPRTYDEFLASLTTGARSDIRRRQKRLAETHQVEVRAVTTVEQVQPAMDALIQLHQKRWADKGEPGQFGSVPFVEDFHRELAQRWVRKGRLVLLTLKADGQIIAATHGYRFGGRTHGLFVGNADGQPWHRYGLGKIMYAHLIQDAIASGSRMLDDGRGIYEHKLELGGKLYGERSLVAVRRGSATRWRFWAALRGAYLVHVLYSRLWDDKVRPRLGLKPVPRHFRQWNWTLAQIFRRVRFPLLGGPRVLEATCLRSPPSEHIGDRPDRQAMDVAETGATRD
jgi:CelD/BcsL family acetyltransferase involved in cellulose biosynthesis